MELKEMMKCPNCGQTLEIKDKEYQCNYCKSIFYNEEINQYNKTLEEVLGETFNAQKSEQIANARFNLYNELRDGDNDKWIFKQKINGDKIKEHCNEIIRYLPNDFRAKFYPCVVNNNIDEIYKLIDSKEAIDYKNDIVYFILHNMKNLTRSKSLIIKLKDFVKDQYASNDIKKCLLEKIEKEDKLIENGYYEPKEIFIIYANEDEDKVSNLMTKYLEKNNVQCFFKKEHLGTIIINNNINEDEILKNILLECKKVLFIASENSKLNNSQSIKLLEEANKQKKIVFEYRIDKSISQEKIRKLCSKNIICNSINELLFKLNPNYTPIVKQEDEDKYIPIEKQDIIFDKSEFANEETKLVKYIGNKTDVIIPNGITEICPEAFKGKTNLLTILFPPTVSIIGEEAFEDCTSLSSINIPNKVKKIEIGTFNGCTSLNSIYIHKNIEIVKQKAFYNCSSLSNVIIENCDTILEYEAFERCGLINYKKYEHCFYLGNKFNPFMILIKGDVFIKNVNLYPDTKVIAPRAFSGCVDIESVNLSLNLEKISHHAFKGCKKLKSINLPSSIKSIEEKAFEECKKLKIYTEIDNDTFKTWPTNWKHRSAKVIYNKKKVAN